MELGCLPSSPPQPTGLWSTKEKPRSAQIASQPREVGVSFAVGGIVVCEGNVATSLQRQLVFYLRSVCVLLDVLAEADVLSQEVS